MTRKEVVLSRLEAMGLSPKRSLGQNFLISDLVIHKILDAVGRLKVEQIIEIGPGLGALTDGLVTSGMPLKLVELDRTFSEYWRSQGIEVIEADALHVDWSQILGGKSTGIVSNLPYQISSRLVVDFSISELPISSMVLMFQKEVAQRLTANSDTDDFGLLSVIAQTFWDIDIVTNAGTQDFYPQPQIVSRVLRFRVKQPPVGIASKVSRRNFLSFVKVAFSQRRKKMTKNLSALYPKANWEEILNKLELPLQVRSEALSVETFHKLYEQIALDIANKAQ